MSKLSSLVILFLLLALATSVPVTAQQRGTQAEVASLQGMARAEQIETLLAMSSEQRRATLKAMAPEERKGLWFEVKRTVAERSGKQPVTGSSTLTPRRHEGQEQKLVTRALGTITYDDGNITNSFNVSNAILGNRFDTASGDPVNDPGTVSRVQAVVVHGAAFTTSSAGFVMLGPQTGGGGAMALFSTFTDAGGAPTATVSYNGLNVTYTGNSFLVLFGAFNNSYVPAFGTGTTQGQGHHGIRGNTGGMGPNITGVTDLGGNVNALIRAGGDVLPVELMSFDSE